MEMKQFILTATWVSSSWNLYAGFRRMGVGRPPCLPPMGNPDMSKVEKSIVFRTRHQCIATFLLKNSKRVNTSFLVIQNGEVKCCYLTRFLKAWFIQLQPCLRDCLVHVYIYIRDLSKQFWRTQKTQCSNWVFELNLH